MYSESKQPWFFWMFLAFLLMAIAVFAWWSWRVVEAGWDMGAGTIGLVITFVSVMLPMTYFTWAFHTYFVHEEFNGLDFGYSGWKVHLDHSQIIKAKKVKIRWIKWGGMGWRIRGMKRIGYITGSGPGIEVSTTVKGRSYTFNCDDCDALLAALEKVGVTVQRNSAV